MKHSRARIVRSLATLLAVVALVPSVAHATAVRPQVTSGPAGKIKHVIVFFQENRSFDEVLGAFCRDHGGRCDGYVGPVRLADGTTVPMTPSPDVVTPDPPHDVATQTKMMNHGHMDGWNGVPKCMAHGVNQCLSYYSPSQIPALSALANAYVVSDRTFSFQNSPSWGGHMAAVAATQDNFTGSIPTPTPGVAPGPGWGCNSYKQAKWIDPRTGKQSMQPSCIPALPGFLDPARYPYNGPFRPSSVAYVPTILDRLDAAHLPWKIYATVVGWSICPTFAECQYGPQRKNVVAPAQILQDAKTGHLPAYAVLNPSGPGGTGSLGTGQHPPGSMLAGDNWIGTVLNALQAGPDWSSTAVFITYDDCGCFYDHVPPGRNPDGTLQGIREPMVIVSPYAKRGATDSNPASFASLLRFTEEAFGLASLTINDAQAYDYAGAFNFSAAPSKPRVWNRARPIPAATLRLLATLPSDDDDDPT